MFKTVSLETKTWRIDNIGGVLFDKDGTLIDSHLYWGRVIKRRAKALIQHYELDANLLSVTCHTMGYDIDNEKLLPQGPIALVSREEVIKIVLRFLMDCGVPAKEKDLISIFIKEHEFFLSELLAYTQILPGVRQILEELKRNSILTAVVTTDTVKNTEKILSHLNLKSFFDLVIGKESTSEAKTTGIPAKVALKQLGISTDCAICIGDAPMDLIMAKNSGLKAGIGVATGQVPVSTLLAYSPYVVTYMNNINVLSK
jgi:phosphoglycolate phosphatase